MFIRIYDEGKSSEDFTTLTLVPITNIQRIPYNCSNEPHSKNTALDHRILGWNADWTCSSAECLLQKKMLETR